MLVTQDAPAYKTHTHTHVYIHTLARLTVVSVTDINYKGKKQDLHVN